MFAGDADGIFRAYDDRNGRILWEFFCGAGVAGAPMTFMLDGEQFIAGAAGGSCVGGRLGDAILIFGAPRPWRAGRW